LDAAGHTAAPGICEKRFDWSLSYKYNVTHIANSGGIVLGTLVRLRRLEPEDARYFADLLGDDREAIFRMERIPYPCTEEAALEWMGRPLAGGFMFGVLRREDSQSVGCIGMAGPAERKSIGYWIGRRFWNRGYATDAVQCLIEFARREGVRELEAQTFPDNPASARALEKSGFAPAGVIQRDLPLRGGLRLLKVHVLRLGVPS
jgi:RimJ/RimL family protein N-acetyltransferase